MRKLLTFLCVALWILPIGSVQAADYPADLHWDNSISPDPLSGLDGPVYALTVFDGKLIAGGQFTTAGGVTANNIAAWDGTSWSALGSGMNNSVHALTTYDGRLIAGGDFTTAGGVAASRIAAWDGSDWYGLGTGIGGPVWALTVYDGKLVVGSFGVLVWDGSSWSWLDGVCVGGECAGVTALTVFEGKLIVADHSCHWVSCWYEIFAWEGSFWSTLWSTYETRNDDLVIYALTVYDGKLVVGNYGVGAWDGSSWSWSGLGSGVNGNVNAFTGFEASLIAGGVFATAGEVEAHNIAAWDGSSWSGLGSGINGEVYALTVFEGSLIAGGEFTSAGGKSAASLARWNICPFMTGDVNTGGVITSADIVYLVNHVFKSGPEPLPCAAAGDVNCSGTVTSADVIGLVNFVFKSGADPCNACALLPGTWSCP